jgi:hypothetical protein
VENSVSLHKTQKILFLGGDTADYLNISLLNGLKSLPDVEVFDYPKSEVLYKGNRDTMQKYIRGNGFTLYFLNDEPLVKRFHLLLKELKEDFFDLVIIGDIHNNFGLYVQCLPYLKKEKTIVLDGADSPSIYPFNGAYWRLMDYWGLPKAHKRFRYYKRELTPETLYYRYYKIIPKPLCKYIPIPKNIYPISFSIPDEKIIKELPVKTKDFPIHIVDEEVCKMVPGSSTTYAFKDETEYYQDLQSARFGITTKRSGWDCLRHYEIAANGSVICFKDLDKKPLSCAPHHLVPGVNCLSYSTYSDLIDQISQISKEDYLELYNNSISWIKSKSSSKIAKSLLHEVS